MGWQPIETAPRDGSFLKLCWMEEDMIPNDVVFMQWGHIQRNGLFPDKVGMWVHPSGSYTWNDEGDGGPTHWMPLPETQK